jgi:hypothetical protein
MMTDSVEKRFGQQSKEMQNLWWIIHKTDSVNLIKVTTVLDQFGWLGERELGQLGNAALFLVIQHSDLTTQQKYLPMMREAVKKGNAAASSLALLEDRVLMFQGKKQIYGSQIRREGDGPYYVWDIEDPLNVDKRRAEMGLGPLDAYVKHWNIIWDAEEHARLQKEKEKKLTEN